MRQTNPKLPEMIFELEGYLGISKKDKLEYTKLTDLQWYYVMSRISRGLILNKQEFAKETGIDNSYVYRLQANEKVAAAMLCMSKTKNRIRINELSDVAWKFAEAGDHRWAKLFMEINGINAADKLADQEVKIDWSHLEKEKPNKPADLKPN